MIDAEEVEHSGVQVVHWHWIFHGGVPEFVGVAVSHTSLDAAAGQHDGKPFDVVVAAAAALRHRGSAEFSAEDDQGIVEHTSLFEIADEGGGGAIDFAYFRFDVAFQVPMVVPVAVVELDEAHASFGETSSEQAVAGERAVTRSGAVGFHDGGGFFRDVHQFRHAGLHLEGHFVLADAGDDFRILSGGMFERVELSDGTDEL